MADLVQELNKLGNKIQPELQEFLSKLIQNLQEKDKTIETLEQKVAYLETSVNRIERYTSKDSIIIQNLPLISGNNLVADVINFFSRVFQTQVNEQDLVACHFLGQVKDIKFPPPVIVKFVHFWKKDRIWARKYWLRNFGNPVNNKPVFMHERLTKRDRDLSDYAAGLGLKVSSKNSAPVVLLKDGQHTRSHFIVDETDADEILASGKAIVRKSAATETPREPRAKRPLPMDSPNMLSNVDITNKLKEYKQASDADGLENFIQNLIGCSPPLKVTGLNESEKGQKK